MLGFDATEYFLTSKQNFRHSGDPRHYLGVNFIDKCHSRKLNIAPFGACCDARLLQTMQYDYLHVIWKKGSPGE
jgi:hypothetical protein